MTRRAAGIARTVLIVALLGMLVPASGCLSCAPLIDVRHCIAETENCRVPEGTAVATFEWDVSWQSSWPDLHRVIARTAEGEHEHEPWDALRERAFWDAVGIPLDEPRKEAHVEYEGETYRIRIIRC